MMPTGPSKPSGPSAQESRFKMDGNVLHEDNAQGQGDACQETIRAVAESDGDARCIDNDKREQRRF